MVMAIFPQDASDFKWHTKYNYSWSRLTGQAVCCHAEKVGRKKRKKIESTCDP
jgi:hypothetical protein